MKRLYFVAVETRIGPKARIVSSQVALKPLLRKLSPVGQAVISLLPGLHPDLVCKRPNCRFWSRRRREQALSASISKCGWHGPHRSNHDECHGGHNQNSSEKCALVHENNLPCAKLSRSVRGY